MHCELIERMGDFPCGTMSDSSVGGAFKVLHLHKLLALPYGKRMWELAAQLLWKGW